MTRRRCDSPRRDHAWKHLLQKPLDGLLCTPLFYAGQLINRRVGAQADLTNMATMTDSLSLNPTASCHLTAISTATME